MEFYRKGKEEPLMNALTSMMAESIMTLCTKCQSDRLVCALRPMCGDRKYTSLLADMGAEEDEIKKTHAFCFSNHLSRLKDIKENKESFSSVRDAKFPLAAFLKVVLSETERGLVGPSIDSDRLDPKKLLRTLEVALTRAWGKFKVAYGDNAFFVFGNRNAMIQIDLERKVVCLSPENEVISRNSQFRAALEVLSTLYSLDIALEEAVRGLDYLSFPFELRSPAKGSSPTASDIAKLVKMIESSGFFATALETPGDGFRLMVELRPPRSGQYMNSVGFSYGHLRNMMQLIARTVNKKPAKE